MKKLLLPLLLSSCFVVPSEAPIPDAQTILVAVVREDGGCALSKVAVFDTEGRQYQVEGCTWGELTFPEGTSFGWVTYSGGPIKSYSVFIIP